MTEEQINKERAIRDVEVNLNAMRELNEDTKNIVLTFLDEKHKMITLLERISTQLNGVEGWIKEIK